MTEHEDKPPVGDGIADDAPTFRDAYEATDGPSPWLKRMRGEDRDPLAELGKLIGEHEPEILKPPPLTMADVPRVPRRIFIICSFLPVMIWTVCDRTWDGLKSICFMIKCDMQEDWASMRRDWNA